MIPKQALEVINEIKKLDGTFTPWEKNFLSSVERQSGYDRQLTSKQEETLNKIYCKLAGGGDHQQKERIG